MDTISIPHIISVLPLPHLVFFPHTHLSLHIPRSFYDRMKEGSQPYPPQADAFLGIVLRKAQPLDEAAVLPIGCVGKVIRFHYLPCGEAVHLDLHGLKRFRMKEGWFEEGYGQAWIEHLRSAWEFVSREKERSSRGIRASRSYERMGTGAAGTYQVRAG